MEKKDPKTGKWEPLSKFVRGTSFDVEGLEPDKKYEFRVAAVNENGTGEPLTTTKPITAKYPFGRYCS